ncbi:hypothetical protein Q7P37_005880 [Cladosporium fusiforme]
MWPLEFAKNWRPFSLPTLGLLTLLGADEVARAVGSMSRNTLTDFMPLLGGHKIAGNQFATSEPGYTMYNLTDGITNTELTAWFTRWLSQHATEKFSVIELKVKRKNRSYIRMYRLAFVLGATVHLALLAFAVLQRDFYGVANGAALVTATLTRYYLIRDILRVYDNAISENASQNLPPEQWAVKGKKKKVLIVRPDGGLVVMYVQLGILLTLFDKRESVTDIFSWAQFRKILYTGARGVDWLAFGVHIVTIGQATLPSQLLVVGVMAIAAVLTIFNVGTQHKDILRNRSHPKSADKGDYQKYEIGSLLKIKLKIPRKQLRSDKTFNSRRSMYALLAPNKKEQRWMREWGLISLAPNEDWYPGWFEFLKGWKKRCVDHSDLQQNEHIRFLYMGKERRPDCFEAHQFLYLGKDPPPVASPGTGVAPGPVSPIWLGPGPSNQTTSQPPVAGLGSGPSNQTTSQPPVPGPPIPGSVTTVPSNQTTSQLPAPASTITSTNQPTSQLPAPAPGPTTSTNQPTSQLQAPAPGPTTSSNQASSQPRAPGSILWPHLVMP